MFSQHNPQLTEEMLRFEPEGKFLERKGRRTKSSKIANELVGMLNSGGGVLVFGIDDDGTVEDLQHDGLSSEIPKDLDPYRKIVHDLIKPPANIELEEVYLSTGELVFIYHVEPHYEGIFQRNDDGEPVYLRVAESNKGPLNREQVAKLEYNRGIRKFEEEARPDFQSEDWDGELCETYCKAMNFEGAFEELAYNRNLANRKSDGGFVFKNAAILLFAKDPERYIPNACARYVRYRGTERRSGQEFNAIKDEFFHGAIPSLIGQLERFMQAVLRDYYYLDLEQGRFQKVPEFPKDAWLEGIVNALYHRSYNVQGNPVMITHFDDRLEIENSGPLPAQVTVENIAHEKFTRNVRVARTLNELGYVRELREGVPRIIESMRKSMLATPEYTDDGTTVKLTLRNRVTNHKETFPARILKRIEVEWKSFSKTQREIIALLFEESELTIDDFLRQTSLSESAIRNNLKALEEGEIIVKDSQKQRDRSARYHFPVD